VKIQSSIALYVGIIATYQTLPAAVIFSTFTVTPPGYIGDNFEISLSPTLFCEEPAMGDGIQGSAAFEGMP
jgi:hypothetical protein